MFGFVRRVHTAATDIEVTADNWRELVAARDASDVYCPDEAASEGMRAAIRKAKVEKDTVGGICEAHVFGCPVGLGSSVDWRTKLDTRLAAAVVGIQAFKGVEIGLGFGCAERMGSGVHDPIRYDVDLKGTRALGFTRDSNNAGGLEGGMTNGMPVVVRGVMKPISTILKGLPSVDLNTKEAEQSQYERSDVCAVSAASVVMESVVAFEIARAVREKFGGDSMMEVDQNLRAYLEVAQALPLDPPGDTIA